jgi:glycosyltransferase involved in cell wall biosynthesis
VTVRIDGRAPLTRFFQKIFGYPRAIRRLVPDSREPFILIEIGAQLPYLLATLLTKLRRRVQHIPFIFDLPPFHSRGLTQIFARIQTLVLRNARQVIVSAPLEGFARTELQHAYQIVNLLIPADEPAKYRHVTAAPPTNTEPLIVYTGTLSEPYDDANLFKLIDQTRSRFRWILAGPDLSQGRFHTLIHKIPADSFPVQHFPNLTRDQLIATQAKADVLISLRNLNPKFADLNRWADSGKLNEYLLARRPVLSTDYPAIPPQMRQYLNLVPDNSTATLINAIEHLVSNPPSRAQLNSAAKFVENLIDPATNAKRISDFLTTTY